MEEYLANMKTLRSYMSDLEEEATKRSAEEQRQRTAIDAHGADLAQVRAQTKQASEESEQLSKARAQLCVEISEKQGRIAALEIECATLKQTLELLHQEIASTSSKLIEKRLFYTKTIESLTVKLQEQQEWLGAFKLKVEASQSKQNLQGQSHGILNSCGSLDKSKQVIEQEKNAISGFLAPLQQMDMKSLEEEHKALQADKAGEIEYFQSLEERINEMKGVSDAVKCRCGLEYKVELGGEAMDLS
uniref:RING-type E3 ubiquitin transferase n=1 Tax=Oryza meridionalis TaxID=40149 RepID=A0A0E0EK77_9ORYZ